MIYQHNLTLCSVKLFGIASGVHEIDQAFGFAVETTFS